MQKEKWYKFGTHATDVMNKKNVLVTIIQKTLLIFQKAIFIFC